MSRTPKLNDLQLILLSTAAQRADGSIFPPAASIAGQDERIRKTIPQLLRRGLVEEVPVKRGRPAWREQDEQPIGLAVTSAGRDAIGPEEAPDRTAGEDKALPGQRGEPSTAARAGSKAEVVMGLLRRPAGATIAELVEATGWLPHTSRAALTGIRKKGHALEKTKRDDATCYRIVEAA